MVEAPLPADPLWRPVRQVPPGLRERYGLAGPDLTCNQAWQVLYEREPELYDRLTEGESLHPGLFAELPLDGATVLDIGAGTGRLTLPCAARAGRVLALEPAAGLRRVLTEKLALRRLDNVTVLEGRSQAIPLAEASVDVCVSAASFGADPELGGEAGLAELRRVTRPGGELFIMWPDDPRWFLDHGFQYHAFGGDMELRFRDLETALLCARVFYGAAVMEHLVRTGRPVVPYHAVGVNPPRDLCRCMVA